MGIFIALIALLMPRVVMFVIFLTTDWFKSAYETLLWPVLGFLFMPYTTLAYMAAMLNNRGAVTGGWLVLVVIAVLVDFSHFGGGRRVLRRRS